jgi:hypothetical protein
MPLFNFHSTFAPLVESGQKRQTIRAERKRPIKVGELAHLYTGCRTKQARKLVNPPPPITRVSPIVMRWKQGERYRSFECRVNGRKLSVSELQDLALADGFPDMHAFKAWFLPSGKTEFKGQLSHW